MSIITSLSRRRTLAVVRPDPGPLPQLPGELHAVANVFPVRPDADDAVRLQGRQEFPPRLRLLCGGRRGGVLLHLRRQGIIGSHLPPYPLPVGPLSGCLVRILARTSAAGGDDPRLGWRRWFGRCSHGVFSSGFVTLPNQTIPRRWSGVKRWSLHGY